MNNKFPLETIGIIRKFSNDPNLKVIYTNDFIEYYRWFIERHYRSILHAPMHGAHTTIIDKRHHSYIPEKDLQQWDNTKVLINYSPIVKMGGFTKTFRNFYIPIQSNMLNLILNEYNIDPPENGFHITVCNSKGGSKPFFGKMIEIK